AQSRVHQRLVAGEFGDPGRQRLARPGEDRLPKAQVDRPLVGGEGQLGRYVVHPAEAVEAPAGAGDTQRLAVRVERVGQPRGVEALTVARTRTGGAPVRREFGGTGRSVGPAAFRL